MTHSVEGNTIDSTRKRNWCFTWNNYPDDWYLTLPQALDLDLVIDITKPGPPLEQPPASAARYVIGLEVGKKCGTPHLQGYFEFPNQRYFGALKKCLPKVSWRECFDEEKVRYKKKGITNREANYNYCTKDKLFYTNIIFNKKLTPKEIKDIKRKQRIQAILDDEYENVKWKPWQNILIEILNERPDRRAIYWFYEPNGNTGKSYLCKYLVLTQKVIIGEGARDNVYNQIGKFIDEHDEDPRIIVLDIPRSSHEYVNYGTLEQMKNGNLYSGKYEGCICAFAIPHIFVFSNETPDYNAMSKDRWVVFNIEKMTFENENIEQTKRIKKRHN